MWYTNIKYICLFTKYTHRSKYKHLARSVRVAQPDNVIFMAASDLGGDILRHEMEHVLQWGGLEWEVIRQFHMRMGLEPHLGKWKCSGCKIFKRNSWWWLFLYWVSCCLDPSTRRDSRIFHRFLQYQVLQELGLSLRTCGWELVSCVYQCSRGENKIDANRETGNKNKNRIPTSSCDIWRTNLPKRQQEEPNQISKWKGKLIIWGSILGVKSNRIT